VRSTRTAVLAWTLTGVAMAVVATAIVLAFLNRASIHDIDQANLLEIVLPIGFAFVGGLVASRLPANLHSVDVAERRANVRNLPRRHPEVRLQRLRSVLTE